jgi:hypothetical protein
MGPGPQTRPRQCRAGASGGFSPGHRRHTAVDKGWSVKASSGNSIAGGNDSRRTSSGRQLRANPGHHVPRVCLGLGGDPESGVVWAILTLATAMAKNRWEIGGLTAACPKVGHQGLCVKSPVRQSKSEWVCPFCQCGALGAIRRQFGLARLSGGGPRRAEIRMVSAVNFLESSRRGRYAEIWMILTPPA